MTSNRLRLTLVGTLAVGLIVGVTLTFLQARIQEQEGSPPSNVIPGESTSPDTTIEIVQDFSYISLTREEMIDQAEIIFVGKVTRISPTQWNQDSGEAWAGGLQLHYIELEVLEPIIDTIGLGEHVTLTALGRSPLEVRADYALKEGDQAVIFARQTKLDWRDGRRPIFQLLGVPSDAHFILGDDELYHGRWNEEPISFEQLLNRIGQRRETLVQP